jgi:hypothetical protein
MTIDFNLYDSFSIKVLAFIQQALIRKRGQREDNSGDKMG